MSRVECPAVYSERTLWLMPKCPLTQAEIMRRQNIGRQGSERGIVSRIGRKAFIILAAVLVLQVVVASSPIPDWMMEWLSHDGVELGQQPMFVVVLGHDIPSQTGLISAYYAAEVGQDHSGITYIVGMPTDDNPDSSAPGRISAR